LEIARAIKEKTTTTTQLFYGRTRNIYVHILKYPQEEKLSMENL